MLNLFSEKPIFSSSKNRVFGLDFNNSTVRILQLDNQRAGLKVAGWSEKKIPKGVIENFEILLSDKFKETLDIARESAKGQICGRRAVISIPENKVFTRVISLPAVEPSQADEAIKWETESNIPISIEDVYYDWQIIRTVGKKMDVLVVATPKKIIDNYLSALDGAGIEVVACEAESIATGRSVIIDGSAVFSLVIDVGLSSTSFAVYQGSMPIFTASSNANGRLFTDLVEKNLGLTFEKAEKYKISNGLVGEGSRAKERMLKIFDPAISLLAQEIEKALEFFSSNLELGKNAQIEKIILSGGGSNLKGLDAYLSARLKKNVVQSDPWINLKLAKKDRLFPPDKSQSMATVIGLALRAQAYENQN